MTYCIEEKPIPSQLKFNFSRIFFPSLMAINLAMMFADNRYIQELILTPEIFTMGEVLVFIQTVFVLFIITLGISAALFSPTYFLLDAGIIYTNKKKVKDTTGLIEIRGVGGWYLNFLKGYAGIGTLISLYVIVYEIFTSMGSDINIALVLGMLSWIIMPFLLSLLSIPMIFILDKTYTKRMQFIQKYTRKLGITTPLSDILSFKDE